VVQQGAGPGLSLPTKLRNAVTALATGGTCPILAALDSEVRGLESRLLTAAQAQRILGDDARIEAVLGCP